MTEDELRASPKNQHELLKAPPAYSSLALLKVLPLVRRVLSTDIPKAASAVKFPRLLRDISIFKFSFICCVLVPAFCSVLYFAFIASDQFSTEMRFAVRTAQFDFGKEASGNIRPGVSTGPSRVPSLAGQEAYVVAAYIRSSAIFEDFPKSLDLKSIFTRSEADFWARLKQNATREEIVQYWRSMVDVNVNNMSGVVTVSVKAFRPEDAYTIAVAIIHASENLANRLSERARNDAVGRAEQEVRRNEQLVRTALENMRLYRNNQQFIDPSSEASSTTALLMRAMSDRIQLQTEYFVAARAMSANAPSTIILKSRLDAVDQQIEKLKARMTSPTERRTISTAISQFEELELQRQFAERLYTMSQDALERARQKAEWQNIYLSVFVPPSLPEFALFPERMNMSLLISGTLLVIWGIVALIFAAVRDHMV